MTNKRIIDEKLLRMIEAVAEETLAAPDEEILSELRDSGITAADVSAQASADLEAAKARVGKTKLLAAKRAVAAEPRRRRSHGLSHAEARKRLTTAFAGSAKSGGAKFTLAARDGKDVPDADIDGLIEDAADLGIDVEGSEDSPDAS